MAWIKAFHIIAVMSWMAGLLYLPRLFVYHVENYEKQELAQTFQVMERKLLRFIMNPAMMISWITGLAMLVLSFDFYSSQIWLWVKLLAIIVMTGFHMKCASWRKQLLSDDCVFTGTYFRYANEVPTLLMIIIVIMAIVEPF